MPIIVSFSENGTARAANVDRYPEVCPVCQLSVLPRFVAATVQSSQVRQICFQCTSDSCRALFIASYAAAGARNYSLTLGETEAH